MTNYPARVEDSYDWKNPNAGLIFQERLRRLRWLRSGTPEARASRVAALRVYYREHPADFINDWAVTVDPRNAERNLPVLVPFLLFPKQRELIAAILSAWRNSTGLAMPKSRDVGASWVAMALSCTMCIFNATFMVGVGSAKEDKVDRAGDPDTLMYKARHFLMNVPSEFTGGWSMHNKSHSAHLRLVFPHTGSSITGEAGNNIGRGGRKAWYLVDESAHLMHPKAVDASLSATTNCRLDFSSVNGMANSFGELVHSGRVPVFNFSWRDDPRKDQAWYDRKCGELDPVIVAQEIDMDFSASVEGQIIPSKWVQAAIDAQFRIPGLTTAKVMSGMARNGYDVADEGRDKCAFVHVRGSMVFHAEAWSGKGGDTLDSTYRIGRLVDHWGGDDFEYDEDGLGVSVKSDSRVMNDARKKGKQKQLRAIPYRGSGAVLYPEARVPGADKRNNEDFFKNYKAQNWWGLRQQFRETMRAVEGQPFDASKIIVIAGPLTFKELGLEDTFKDRSKLMVELSQAVWKWDTQGKMLVDKLAEGAASPNLADGVVIARAPRNAGMSIAHSTVDGLEASLSMG